MGADLGVVHLGQAGSVMNDLVNLLRVRSVLLSRHYKGLVYGDNGELRRDAERVLADLREFCGVSRATIFDPEPLIMARREGRREVFVRIQNFLNLDEKTVQQLMELDQ